MGVGWGEEHCKQISLACLGSARSVWVTLGLPPHMACVLFPSTLLRLPGCSVGELSKADPVFHALPRSKLLRFRFLGTPQRHRLSWVCVLCPSQVRAAQPTRWLLSALSQVCSASYHLLGPGRSVSWVRSKSAISGVPCVSSGELISDCDPPGRCQPSRVPRRRLATGSLLAVW